MDKKYRLIQVHSIATGNPYWHVQSANVIPDAYRMTPWLTVAMYDSMDDALKAFDRIKFGEPDIIILREWPAKS